MTAAIIFLTVVVCLLTVWCYGLTRRMDRLEVRIADVETDICTDKYTPYQKELFKGGVSDD